MHAQNNKDEKSYVKDVPPPHTSSSVPLYVTMTIPVLIPYSKFIIKCCQIYGMLLKEFLAHFIQ